MRVLLALALLALALLLVQRMAFSFMAQRPEDYAGTRPALDLRVHLAGPLVSEAVVYGPNGRVSTRFVAELQGTWGEDGGVLAEDFRYLSGRTQQREWRIATGEGGRFVATADDVIGEAVGQVSGSTAVMRYRLRLPEDAGGWALDVTDWLYLTDDGVIINRSQFRRFGIKLAELVGTIRPAGD